ncbi:MAG: glycosyltransferase family 1 protein [Pseudomonadota bacterium]
MNILIDFSQIPIKKSGVGTYAVNLIRQISALKMQTEDTFYVLIQDDEKIFDDLDNDRIVFVRVNGKIFRRLFFRFFLEQLFIPWLIWKHRIDVVHSLHYSFPVCTFSAKKVVTICDMTFFLFPEVHLTVKRYYFRFWIKAAAGLADKIITISRSTRDDFCRITGAKKSCITVVPLASSISDLPGSQNNDFTKLQNQYNITTQYLLFIGTIEPRKNICRLIHAFEKLNREMPFFTLVLIGQKGWGYREVELLARNSMARDHIVFTEFVEETEKLLFLNHAKLFLYPSIYEGFGLPVLEALEFGIPTITSNISSMPEVAGDAAIKVNPFHVDEIYNAMKLLLTDDVLYCSYQQKARHQARMFSWEKTARETLHVYRSCKTI